MLSSCITYVIKLYYEVFIVYKSILWSSANAINNMYRFILLVLKVVAGNSLCTVMINKSMSSPSSAPRLRRAARALA